MRTGVAIAVAVAVVAAASPAAAQDGAIEQRSVTVRDLRLDIDDVLTIALHPSTTPIELTARGLDLEACPGTWEGGVGTPEGSSWPRSDGFAECIPLFDGVVSLPSAAAGGGSMHLVVAVRARSAARRPGVLTISYEPVDGFFMVTPPAVEPDRHSPSIVVTPRERIVSAGVSALTNDSAPPNLGRVRVVVRQHGRRVREAPSTDAEATHAWPVYAPVKPSTPVSIRAVNDGRERIRFAIGLDVR